MSIQPTDSSYLTSVSYVATDKTSEAAKKTENNHHHDGDGTNFGRNGADAHVVV